MRQWASRVRVVSVYGPTEATICTHMVTCSKDGWTEPEIGAALLHGPEVLFLDEPTAALDPETERAIQQTLRAPDRACTVIVITHRESFVELADLVLELREGKVAARC